MTALIEGIVIDLGGLVEKDLFASCLDGGHNLLVSCRQVIQVELLLLDEEK